jgi:DNA-directed RNA polymerase subunit omega
MLYPPVAQLLKDVESRYLLVNVVAQRARQIAAEAEEFHEDLPEKPVTLAIQEVADGKLSASLKDEYMN